MKIAMIGQKRIPSREGGVEIVVEELSKRLVKMGHEVVCYNRRGQKPDNDNFVHELDGVRVKSVFTLRKRGFAAFTASFFATVCAAFENFDVVHYHAEGPALMCFIPKLFKKKVVVTIHGLDWQRIKWGRVASKIIKLGEKMAVKYADEIIVLSENTKKYFKETYNRDVVFIPNGAVKSRYAPPVQITQRWGLEKNQYILFLGRIVPEKGIGYLLEAYKQLNTDKKLVIAGKSGDCDDYFNKIQEEAEKTPGVILTGFVKDEELSELFSNAYVFVLPSDLEGMPISLLEAMSYGNCCVVSDIPECVAVVENHGVLFKQSDSDNLAKELQRLCDNEAVVEQYKNNSAEFVLSKYNWDNVVERTVEVYLSKY